MSFADLLDRSAVIQKRSATTSYGSDTVSFATSVAAYRCRIFDVTPKLTRRAGGEEVYITSFGECPTWMLAGVPTKASRFKSTERCVHKSCFSSSITDFPFHLTFITSAATYSAIP